MNQIVAPKLQSDSKYPSVLRTSVCDRAGIGITFYIVITPIIMTRVQINKLGSLTPISCRWIESDTIRVEY